MSHLPPVPTQRDPSIATAWVGGYVEGGGGGTLGGGGGGTLVGGGIETAQILLKKPLKNRSNLA